MGRVTDDRYYSTLRLRVLSTNMGSEKQLCIALICGRERGFLWPAQLARLKRGLAAPNGREW
jgi:hypothetical protein